MPCLPAGHIARGLIDACILPAMMRFVLKVLSARFTVARLGARDAIPPWALAGGFYSITRTSNELSIVCESSRVPGGIRSETGWRALEVRGPLAFEQVGIMAALTEVLAGQGISIFAVSTSPPTTAIRYRSASDSSGRKAP